MKSTSLRVKGAHTVISRPSISHYTAQQIGIAHSLAVARSQTAALKAAAAAGDTKGALAAVKALRETTAARGALEGWDESKHPRDAEGKFA